MEYVNVCAGTSLSVAVTVVTAVEFSATLTEVVAPPPLLVITGAELAVYHNDNASNSSPPEESPISLPVINRAAFPDELPIPVDVTVKEKMS